MLQQRNKNHVKKLTLEESLQEKIENASKIDKKEYLAAMKQSTTDARAIKSLLQGAMTDKIDDREIFMKGIDYSYYYEQTD